MDEAGGEPAPPVLPAVRWGERFRAVVVPETDHDGWWPAAHLFGDGLEEALRAIGTRRAVPHPAVAGALLMEHYAQRVLRGAVAHAATTAFLALSWPKPDPAEHLGALRAFLDRAGLADTVTVEAREAAGEWWLYAERRTCCLAFRAGDHGYCATCPVTPEPDRHRSFVEAASTYRARHTKPVRVDM